MKRRKRPALKPRDPVAYALLLRRGGKVMGDRRKKRLAQKERHRLELEVIE